MAKRMSKKEMQGTLYLVIIVAIVGGIITFFEAVGYVIPIV